MIITERPNTVALAIGSPTVVSNVANVPEPAGFMQFAVVADAIEWLRAQPDPTALCVIGPDISTVGGGDLLARFDAGEVEVRRG